MKLFCSKPECDFEFEDNPTNAALVNCPKCGGVTFSNPKQINWHTMALASGAYRASLVMFDGVIRSTYPALPPFTGSQCNFISGVGE